jgi:hypothetical protein
MPFTGSTYSLPSGSIVSDGQTAEASQHNTPLQDIETSLSLLMLQSVFDPNTVGGDAFSMDSMVEGTNTKILTSAERTKISDAVQRVSTRTALKALDTASITVANLTESGREGTFVFRSGDYASLVTADTQEGVYIAADGVATSSGAWVRAGVGMLNVRWFGAVNDNSADAYDAFNGAINLAYALDTSLNNEPYSGVYAAPGYYQLGTGLTLPTAIKFHCFGFLYYTPTTGTALICGSDTNVHQHYDIHITGIRATNGNSAIPSSINTSGCTGVEIRKMQFSRVYIGLIIAFTEYGFFANSTNDQFTGQQIQDNEITLGLIAFNGAGVIAESVNAGTGSFQVNEVKIYNSFSNFRNIEIGQSGDNNTNNNQWDIYACDDAHSSGTELRCWGLYNRIILGFTEGSFSLESGSGFNKVWVGNKLTNLGSITDAGDRNKIEIADYGWFTPNEGTAGEFTSNAGGANIGPNVNINRLSPSPAANDALGALRFRGFNTAATPEEIEYAVIRADVPSVADGNENGRLLLDTYVGGSYSTRATLWQGLTVGAVADMGGGTINNSGGYYVNGTRVITAQQGAVSDVATGGSATASANADAINAILVRLRNHGLFAT